MVRATAPVSVVTRKDQLPDPWKERVPHTRTMAESSARAHSSLSPATRESSSLTWAVKDMETA